MTSRRRLTRASAGVLVSLFSMCAAIGQAAPNAAPNIKVSGPITGGTQGKPFNVPEYDLAKHGYVVEEFFFEGEASAYQLAAGTQQSADGKWQVARKKESVPYKSRILVVRPADARRFNGTVIVHWQNVTAGYEVGSVAANSEYLRGYAWVGVSAQKAGIDGFPGPQAAGMKVWDPQRYGSLNHPGDDYSYDIYTQAARIVGPARAQSPSDPMGKLPVQRLVAAGASQSAARIRAYINGIHPLERTFAGYIPYIDFGRPTAFETPAAAAGGSGALGRTGAQIRTDLDVPVFVVNSETEAEGYVGVRQPDTAKYRFWEVPGSSHVSIPRALIGKNDAEYRPGLKVGDLQSPNWLAYLPVYDAAVRHMHKWLTAGTQPPKAPLIEMTAEQPPKIKRDERGNALGGIRLADFAVPSAEHRGNGTTKPGGYRLGFLYGFSREFTAEELKALYPSSAAFLTAYDRALKATVDAGYVLPEDAAAMQQAATAWAQRL
jgi:hypothetical protein